jgi:hypothetical protein
MTSHETPLPIPTKEWTGVLCLHFPVQDDPLLNSRTQEKSLETGE